eukprot:PhM_4_TR13625/c0_g1_i1/m.63861/K15424/PPP4R1; serine/threonine-protein phosphatase 4 regulatory subunit 1
METPALTTISAPDIDDSLPPLERLERYHNASEYPVQRATLAKELADIASSVDVLCVISRILPIAQTLARDDVVEVRLGLASALGPLTRHIKYSSEDDELARVLSGEVLPLLHCLLRDENLDVRTRAIEEAHIILRCVAPEPLWYVLVEFLSWMKSTDETDSVVGLSIVMLHADVFGGEVTVEYVLPEISKLFNSDEAVSITLKMAFVEACGKAMTAVGTRASWETLFPIFRKLAMDPMVSVRKACASFLYDVTQPMALRLPAVRTGLTKLMLSLVRDKSEYVRVAACGNLGRVVTDLSPAPPTELVDEYLKQCMSTNVDIVSACAFTFCGVVVSLGRDAWDQRLRPTFLHLTRKGADIATITSLAFAAGVMSGALGEETTNTDIVPFLMRTLEAKDRRPQYGTAASLPSVLAHVPDDIRSDVVERVCLLAMETKEWRFTVAILEYVLELADVVPVAVVLGPIVDFIVHCLQHYMAEVNYLATYVVAGVLVLLEKKGAGEVPKNRLLKMVQEELLVSTCWRDRILYIDIAQQLIERGDVEFYRTHFEDNVLGLCRDPVVNVRLVLSRVVGVTYMHRLKNEAVTRTLQSKLLQDADEDVRGCAGRHYQTVRDPRRAAFYLRR